MAKDNKKILITAFDFFPNTGGVATYAWELANSMSNKGYQVKVVAKKREGRPPPSRGFTIDYIDLPEAGLLAYPVMAKYLIKVFRDWQPTKVICTLWMPGALAALTARLISRHAADIFTVVHAMEVIESSSDWKKRLRSQLQFLKKWTFKKVNKVFCISNFTRKLVIDNTDCPEDKIVVVHNGVNPEKFRQANLPNYTTDRWEQAYPVLLTICRLVPHKGIDNVIRSLPLIKQKLPGVHYIIGGKGPDQERLQELTTELDLQKNVSFLGYIEDKHLPVFYNLADLFVLLSREELPNVEGFGLVFLEAAACGTPSLGGRSGGIPDAIVEGETGWLVDPHNPPAVAEKILQIFSRPEIPEEMGKKAYEYTIKNRMWDQVSGTILAHMYQHEK